MRVTPIFIEGLLISLLLGCSSDKPRAASDPDSGALDAGQHAAPPSDASPSQDAAPVVDAASGLVGESDVPLAATVAQLSDGEAMKLCAWNNQLTPLLQPSPQQLCTLMAIGEGSEGACQTRLALCSLTTPAPGNQSDCSKVTAAGLPEGCSLAIASYEACLLAKVEANRQRFAALSCANAGQTAPPVVEPEACRDWPARCAALAP